MTIRSSLTAGSILITLVGCAAQRSPQTRPSRRGSSASVSAPTPGPDGPIQISFANFSLSAKRPAQTEQQAVRSRSESRQTSAQVIGWEGQVKGELTKDGDSQVVIDIDINGVKRVIEFPYDENSNGSFTRSFWVPSCYLVSNYQIVVRLILFSRSREATADAKVTALEMKPASAR